MPSPDEYEVYVKQHCPRLYGKQVMMWIFSNDFREAVEAKNEQLIGELLAQEIGHTPRSEGFAACREWEEFLGR